MHSYPHVLSTIGHTPLVALKRLYPETSIRIYGKLEAFNPGGSIKDRTAFSILSHALREGQVAPGDTVIESSSGNMAIGLAQACLYLGLQLIVVVDPNTNTQVVSILKAYGAEVDHITHADASGGYLTNRLQRVQELLDTKPNSYWPNQYANPRNPQAHYQTMREIVEALDGKLDYLLAATSTCGTIMGCAQYAREAALSTRIIAVDAVGSVLFNTPAAPRRIPGHGAGRPSLLLDQDLIDDHLHISDEESVAGCRRLLQREAILAGGSSGAVVAAMGKMLPQMPPDASCVLILCDRGERYLDTIYSDQWVEEQFGKPTRSAPALRKSPDTAMPQ